MNGGGARNNRAWQSRMEEAEEAVTFDQSTTGGGEEFRIDPPHKSTRPIDVLVSTPVKALEMVRGYGWDRVEGAVEASSASRSGVVALLSFDPRRRERTEVKLGMVCRLCSSRPEIVVHIRLRIENGVSVYLAG